MSSALQDAPQVAIDAPQFAHTQSGKVRHYTKPLSAIRKAVETFHPVIVSHDLRPHHQDVLGDAVQLAALGFLADSDGQNIQAVQVP